MNEQILKELKNYTNSVFDNLNIELSQYLNDSFNEQLTNSVNRMVRENRTSSVDIERAKQAFETFIITMYPYREKRFGKKDFVRIQALNESKSSLCPLWPIC